MREILFRAKSKFDKDNKWVYGDLLQGENSYISTEEEFYSAVVGLDGHLSTCIELVDKETIGQYTGRCDKNGTKIFEGDIVGCFCNTQIFQVKWCDVRGGYFLDNVVICSGSEPAPECLGNLVDTIEIIGNIFDNPEILEQIEE